jgi:hypothetical protein
MKATIIAAARPLAGRANGGFVDRLPAPPSYEQGFGFPVLDDALYFSGDKVGMRVVDSSTGLAAGESATLQVKVRAGSQLRAVLVWTDPPGVVRGVADTTPQLVNDLDLRVGSTWGNDPLHPGQPDRLNNVEGVTLDAAPAGQYTVTVTANRLASGPRQSYALVVTGDFENEAPARHRAAKR